MALPLESLGRKLTGPGNHLWAAGAGAIERNEPARLEAALYDDGGRAPGGWIAAVDRDAAWSDFSPETAAKARAQALGIAEALGAAARLRLGKLPDAERSLAAALGHLDRALGVEGAPALAGAFEAGVESRAALERLLASAGADARARAAPPAPGRADPLAPLAALRSLLAAADPTLRALIGPDPAVAAAGAQRIILLSDNKDLGVFAVDLHLAESPWGRSVISPELHTLGAMALDDPFRGAVEDALAAALATAEPALERHIWIRWALAERCTALALTGASAGAAFGAGGLALLEGKPLDPDAAVTAALVRPTPGGGERAWALARVDAIDAKAAALLKHCFARPDGAARPLLVLPRAIDPGGVEHDVKLTVVGTPRSYRRRGAATLREALEAMVAPRYRALRTLLERLGPEARGLARHMRIRPVNDGERLRGFCLLPRLAEAAGGAAAGGDEDGAGAELSPAGYTIDCLLAATAPEDAKGAGPAGRDEVPRAARAPAAPAALAGSAGARVIVRALAGAGKTMLLWIGVTEAAAALLAALGRGEWMDAASFRVPLALPLSRLTPDVREEGSLDPAGPRSRHFESSPHGGSATRRPSGAEEGEAACRGRCGGGSASPARIVDLAIEYTLGAAGELSADPPRVDPDLEVLRVWLEEKAAAGAADFYLDALDEVPDGADGVEWLDLAVASDRLKACRTLLTTRPHPTLEARLHWPGALPLAMLPFRPADVRLYVQEFFRLLSDEDSVADEVLAEINRSPGPRELARQPLLLALLVELKREFPRQPLPAGRLGVLLEAAALLVWRQDKERLKRGLLQRAAGETSDDIALERLRGSRTPWKLAVLAELAGRCWDAEGPRPITDGDVVAVLPGKAMDPCVFVRSAVPEGSPLLAVDSSGLETAAKLLNELRADGFLVREGPKEHVVALRTFHEAFHAVWLARELGAKPEPAFRDWLRSGGGGRSVPPLLDRRLRNVWVYVPLWLDDDRRRWLLEELRRLWS